MIRYLVLAAALAGLATAVPAQTPAQWDYQGKYGPLSWGKLDPAYRACSQGLEQSPIGIHGAHRNKSLQPIEFHYIAGGVTLKNTGRTIQVLVHPGSYIVAGGVRYNLESYDFHRPAEHAVNGRLTDMDVQFMHRSADGKLAILAVQLTESRDAPNAMMSALWEHLPQTVGSSEQITDMINAGGLLPAERGYWTYIGSLTTPPCTEGVRWFVMEQPVTISTDQMQAFRRLYKINSRPLQDPHDRIIEGNE